MRRAARQSWSAVLSLVVLLIVAACAQVEGPPAPTGLIAVGGPRQVELTWDGSASVGANWFDIYAGSSADALEKVASVAASVDSYTVPNLLGFSDYYFAVSARSTVEGPRSLGAVATPWQTGFPDSSFMVLRNDVEGYLSVPHAAALNPTSGLTIEGWVRFDVLEDECVSLVGKDYIEAFWIGWCDDGFMSYAGGETTYMYGGAFAAGYWTHFAVTSDGEDRRHYLDGVLMGSQLETEGLTTSNAPLRIGSDVSWNYPPSAALNEVRLWNRALTQAEIQDVKDRTLTEPEPGLVAVWPLDHDGRDALGAHDGSLVGAPSFGLSGRIGPSDDAMPVVFISTPNCTAQGSSPVHYQVVPFFVETEGVYRLTLQSSNNDASFYVYQDSFDPEDALTNCVAGSNTSVADRKSVEVSLTAGGPHYMVVFNDDIDQTIEVDYTASLAKPPVSSSY